MKTSRYARRIVILRLRGILVSIAIAAIAGTELWLGESMAGRIGQSTALQSAEPQPPNMNASDLMASFPAR